MKFIDLIGCVGSATLLLLAPAWIPYVGTFLSLLAPLPFLYTSSRLGLNQGLKTVAITFLIVGFIAKLTGNLEIMFSCVEFSLLGLVISEIFKRRLSFGLTILCGTIFMLALGVISLSLIALSKGTGPLDLVLQYLHSNMPGAIDISEDVGLAQEKVLRQQGWGRSLMDIITKLYPALLITGTGLVVWLNVVLSKPLFRMGKLEYPEFGPLDRWQAPERIVWGVIAAGFALFISPPSVRLLAINALLVMSIIYAFHGLSIVMFFFNKYGVPPWIRFGAYVLIILQQVFLVGLALAGLFDQWIDFRKIRRKDSTN